MKIVHDEHYAEDGTLIAYQWIDTEKEDVQAMLRACKDSELDRMNAGYAELTARKGYPGKTRWEVIEAEAVRLDDQKARSILGV